jgi:hypothetical protein
MVCRSFSKACALGALSFLAMTTPAVAGETDCRGTIGAGTLDDVRVPRGASCELQGTVVNGNVSVARDAVLHARAIRVAGDVQGERAARVTVAESNIGGSFTVTNGGAADLSRSRVSGNVQLVSNKGGVVVSHNLMQGNLQCERNEPPPTGGGNAVEGNAEGQCRSLAGASPSEAGPGSGPPGTVTPAPAPAPAPPPGGPGSSPPPAEPGSSPAAGRRSSRPAIWAVPGGRVIAVRLRCTSRMRCIGRVVLRARGRQIGSRRFVIASRARKVVRVRLDRRAQALLRRTGRLRVRVTASTGARAVSRIVTVRL